MPPGSSRALNPALVAIVARRADMDVSDVVTLEQGLCPRRDSIGPDDAAAAVDDAVVLAIATHYVVGAFEHLGKRLGFGGALAFFRMQEDRPGLGERLEFRERPVGQDEIGI